MVVIHRRIFENRGEVRYGELEGGFKALSQESLEMYSITEDHIHQSAAALYLANVLDMLFTMIWMFFYGVGEMNPFMNVLLQSDPYLFIFYKTIFAGVFIYLLAVVANKVWHYMSILAATLIYFGVVGYHLSFAVQIFSV